MKKGAFGTEAYKQRQGLNPAFVLLGLMEGRMYKITKKTREGCTPHSLKLANIEVNKETGIICVYVGFVRYYLDLVNYKPQLLCLIADSLPEPIRFSELEALGFKRT